MCDDDHLPLGEHPARGNKIKYIYIHLKAYYTMQYQDCLTNNCLKV